MARTILFYTAMGILLVLRFSIALIYIIMVKLGSGSRFSEIIGSELN